MQTIAQMVMILTAYVYLVVSMTTIKNKWPQALFTSSLLKLANYTIHEGETCYVCVFEHFHDYHKQTNGLRHFHLLVLLHFSNLEAIATIHEGETCYVCVFQHFHDYHKQTNGLRHCNNITTSSLLKLANYTIHEGETCYVCVFEHFHDCHEQTDGLRNFSIHFFTSHTCKLYIA